MGRLPHEVRGVPLSTELLAISQENAVTVIWQRANWVSAEWAMGDVASVYSAYQIGGWMVRRSDGFPVMVRDPFAFAWQASGYHDETARDWSALRVVDGVLTATENDFPPMPEGELVSSEWRDQTIAHARIWHGGKPDDACCNCYSAQPTNQQTISCNDAESPWPQAIVQSHWWCSCHERANSVRRP